MSFASFSKDPIISEESTKGVKAMLYQSTQQVRREAAHGRGDGEQPDPWIEKHATMMAGRILRNETSSRRVQMSIQEMTVQGILFVEDSDGTKQRRHAQKESIVLCMMRGSAWLADPTPLCHCKGFTGRSGGENLQLS